MTFTTHTKNFHIFSLLMKINKISPYRLYYKRKVLLSSGSRYCRFIQGLCNSALHLAFLKLPKLAHFKYNNLYIFTYYDSERNSNEGSWNIPYSQTKQFLRYNFFSFSWAKTHSHYTNMELLLKSSYF